MYHNSDAGAVFSAYNGFDRYIADLCADINYYDPQVEEKDPKETV
jgi:hypothetical protein